jgi:hypothetical protein
MNRLSRWDVLSAGRVQIEIIPGGRQNSIRLPSDRDAGTYLFGFPTLENARSQPCLAENTFSRADRMPSWQPMSRFFPSAKRSLDSLLSLITDLVADGLLFLRLLFRSRTALSAEVLFLRKQLAFYEERQVQPRRLNDSARICLILWSRLCNWKEALVIVKPETLIRWHRKGFKLFWKWKLQAGRPRIPENIRKLIVQMAQENPTWAKRASQRKDLFAELEDVCPQSCPVHRRLRFPGRGDDAVSNSLCVPPDGGRDTAHRALQRHRTSNGSLEWECGGHLVNIPQTMAMVPSDVLEAMLDSSSDISAETFNSMAGEVQKSTSAQQSRPGANP